MKALVYQGQGKKALVDRPKREIPTDGGGTIANIGVYGAKVDLHLERLWSQNITITTRLVDTVTTPMLLKTVQAGKIDPTKVITPRFKLDRIMDACETFGHAANTRALNVLIEA